MDLMLAQHGSISENVSQPITQGVPFPSGSLWRAEAIRLEDPGGTPIPVQHEVLAWWPDASLKWVLLDWIAHGPHPDGARWRVSIAEGLPDPALIAEVDGLSILEAPGLISVDTGFACFQVSTRVLKPLTGVQRNGHALLGPAGLSIVLKGVTDPREESGRRVWNPSVQAGRHGAAGHKGVLNPSPLFGCLEAARVEAQGPVRATIALEGYFVDGRLEVPSHQSTSRGGDQLWRDLARHVGQLAGRRPRRPLRFVCRLSFWSGTGLTRVSFTLHNGQRAQHPGGLWDLGDEGSILFEDLSLELALPASSLQGTGSSLTHAQHGWTWRECPDQEIKRAETGRFKLYQDSSGGPQWASRNHLNRHGRVVPRIRGYQVTDGDRRHEGTRASPCVTWRGDAGHLRASVPDFWQQFPKTIEGDEDHLRLALFPAEQDDLHELQGGEQKTHLVWLAFGDSPANVSPLEWTHAPARTMLDPVWVHRSGVLPCFPDPAVAVETPLEPLLQGMLAGEQSYFERREVIDEYGWRHFGEVHADHEAAYFQGESPVISHFNNQYDFVQGLLWAALRSGDGRWLDLAEPMARHVIDIDLYHTCEDKPAYNGGLFWHTDHYVDAGTSTHRTFSRQNAEKTPGYGGGPAAQHNGTSGLLLYHHLTGDPLARDAVLELADWVVQMDDGRRNLLAFADSGATGWASATFDFHGPGRGGGYSIYALLDAWSLSGQRHYLAKAEALIRRCVHPDDDIEAYDLMDAELRWSYTIFLSALDRYLRIKAETDQIDVMYAYAQASLVRYAVWMLEHERPYFDRVETLEFPTETWAGQELRKANVLGLAAAHTDEPLRARLRARARALSQRAWSDLMGFPSRSVCRSMAILTNEGPRDVYLQQGVVPMARGGAAGFPAPSEPFVGQRRRVMRGLRVPRAVADSILRLFQLESWRALLEQRGSLKP